MFTQYSTKTVNQIIKGVVAWVLIKRTTTRFSGLSPNYALASHKCTERASFHDMLHPLQEPQG